MYKQRLLVITKGSGLGEAVVTQFLRSSLI